MRTVVDASRFRQQHSGSIDKLYFTLERIHENRSDDTLRVRAVGQGRKRDLDPRSQDIAEAAFFLGRDGLIVPSARSNAANVAVYCDRIAPAALKVVGDKGLIAWDAWRRTPFGF
jgi:hypothetical protein